MSPSTTYARPLRSVLPLSVVAAAFLCIFPAHGTPAAKPGPHRMGGNWLRFGYDPARHNSGPAKTGITRQNVGKLKHMEVPLEGTVDSSPVYLRNAIVNGRKHDVFVVTTSYGKVYAVGAGSGRVLWSFVPPDYDSWAGTYRITTASPVAGPDGKFVYSAAPDGRVYKLRVDTGAPVRSGSWPALLTSAPSVEKISSPLNLVGDYVLATTASFGDMWEYQGHVVVVDRRTGRHVRVWNALCSDQKGLFDPVRSCGAIGAGIWARSGVVVQPGTRNLVVATGNGFFNGTNLWANSVLLLSPNGSRVIQSWTPENHQELAAEDLDIGSSAPALMTKRLALQAAKDGRLRLLNLANLNGRAGTAVGATGGALQTLRAPEGLGVFSAPAVWKSGATVWTFVANKAGVAAYTLSKSRLVFRWQRLREGGFAGTSPVVAGGLLYVYNTSAGTLEVYLPTTGKLLTSLPAGAGHWNTPVITDGRIALGAGNANAQHTTGVLNIYSVP